MVPLAFHSSSPLRPAACRWRRAGRDPGRRACAALLRAGLGAVDHDAVAVHAPDVHAGGGDPDSGRGVVADLRGVVVALVVVAGRDEHPVAGLGRVDRGLHGGVGAGVAGERADEQHAGRGGCGPCCCGRPSSSTPPSPNALEDRDDDHGATAHPADITEPASRSSRIAAPNIVTVTEHACRWCGRRFEAGAGAGRPRLYCRQSCRQRDYEARRRSLELGLGEHELVITRTELESIRDRLFVLERTVEDAEVDLQPAGGPAGEGATAGARLRARDGPGVRAAIAVAGVSDVRTIRPCTARFRANPVRSGCRRRNPSGYWAIRLSRANPRIIRDLGGPVGNIEPVPSVRGRRGPVRWLSLRWTRPRDTRASWRAASAISGGPSDAGGGDSCVRRIVVRGARFPVVSVSCVAVRRTAVDTTSCCHVTTIRSTNSVTT